MLTESQPSGSAEKPHQDREDPEHADLMAALKKAQMRAETYSRLDDPLGAHREAQRQHEQEAEAIRRRLAGEQPDEHSEAA